MILFHGTNQDFGDILLTKCTPHKDFGKGFYLTPMRARAQERANDKCDKENCGIPTILAYEWDETETPNLKILRFDGTDEQWLDFILTNRKRSSKQEHGFDVVIGPVADDGVITSISLYEARVIDKPTLIERLRYAKPYIQYCFCTERAVKLLHRI